MPLEEESKNKANCASAKSVKFLMSSHFSEWRVPRSADWPECLRMVGERRVLLDTPTGKQHRGRPSTRCLEDIFSLAWPRLDV